MSESRSNDGADPDRAAPASESNPKMGRSPEASPEPVIEGAWRPSVKLAFLILACVLLWATILFGVARLIR
jgi:hypothetical protein